MSGKTAPSRNDDEAPLRTPDGRYLIVRGRMWRASNPALSEAERAALVNRLMNARRAVAAALRAGDEDAEARARHDVEAAKVALGERGPVWWSDGAPDLNRRLVQNTAYADWYATVAQPTEAPTSRADRHEKGR